MGLFDDIGNLFTGGGGGIGDIADPFKGLLDQIKHAIWDPINEGLVIPAKEFFDMMTMYINCSISKINSFGTCFFWYALYVTQETLYLIVELVLILLRALTNVDLFPILNFFFDKYEYVSNICAEYTGFQLFIFPYTDKVNADCFVCEVENQRESKLKTALKEFKQDIKYGQQKFKQFTKDVVGQIPDIAPPPDTTPTTVQDNGGDNNN
jgi:hypothetical protein